MSILRKFHSSSSLNNELGREEPSFGFRYPDTKRHFGKETSEYILCSQAEPRADESKHAQCTAKDEKALRMQTFLFSKVTRGLAIDRCVRDETDILFFLSK
mgnify:CR=1 FL=1|jgi:hypothetical protein